MLFITPDMFEYEPVQIANVLENGDKKTAVIRFIATYEKRGLVELLGDCLTKELYDSFELVSSASKYTLKANATQAIKDLVEGKEYDKPEDSDFNNVIVWDLNWAGCGCGCGEDGCTKRYWKGIVQEDKFLLGTVLKSAKRSFLGDYIYYHHSYVNRSQTTGTGQKVVEGENSTSVQNFSKRIDRYNEFVFQVLGRANETSLYQFLSENKADYPTWSPNCNLRFKEKY